MAEGKSVWSLNRPQHPVLAQLYRLTLAWCSVGMGAVEKAGKKEKELWHGVVERRKATEPTW